jgi:hypothetical protein
MIVGVLVPRALGASDGLALAIGALLTTLVASRIL